MAEESKQFWENIWSQSADHKKDAKWLQDLRGEVNAKKQEKVDITRGSLKKILRRMPNWKSPGPDLVQGFWLKNFSSLHERVRFKLKERLDSGFLPSWFTRGRTSLLQKDKNKGNEAINCGPRTCLFAINVEIIDKCNCRSDMCTFTSKEVVTRRAEKVQERF